MTVEKCFFLVWKFQFYLILFVKMSLISCVTQNDDGLPFVAFKGMLCCCLTPESTSCQSCRDNFLSYWVEPVKCLAQGQ